MGKLTLFLCLIIPFIVHGTVSPIFFYISLANSLSYLVAVLAIPNIIALSAMKEYKARVKEAYYQGATQEEIDILLNEEIEIQEKDNQAVPKWLYMLAYINLAISFIFLIFSIIKRIS